MDHCTNIGNFTWYVLTIAAGAFILDHRSPHGGEKKELTISTTKLKTNNYTIYAIKENVSDVVKFKINKRFGKIKNLLIR